MAAMATPERLFPNASSSDIRTRFHLGKQLGQGGTGVVTVCSDLQTGIPVAACKSVPKSKLQRRDALEELQREVHANRRVRGHAHVVELRGLYEDAQAVHLVMDLCKGGDLYDFLIARSPVAEPVAAEIARQVLLALAHCHAVGVMHRDIKPENILLLAPDDGSGRVHVKLADFGLAVLLRPGQRAVGMYGSAIYMSPEVVCRRPYGHAVDLWGLGVIVYLALAGTPLACRLSLLHAFLLSALSFAPPPCSPVRCLPSNWPADRSPQRYPLLDHHFLNCRLALTRSPPHALPPSRAGYMPFWGSTDEELFLRILRNSPDFRADPWPRVSPQAVDFIRSLLHSDPAHRPSALAALQHPWIVQHCGGPAASPAPSLSAEPMPGMTPKAPAATRKSAPAGESGAKVHPEAGKAQQLPRAGSMEAGGEAAVVAPPSALNKIRVGGAGQSGGQSAAHQGRAMDVDSDQSVPIAPVASASSAASAASAMPAPMKQLRQAPAGAQRQWPTQQVEAAQAQAQGGEEVQPLQRTRRTSQPREKREGRGKSTRGASAAEQQVRGRSRHRESATAPRAMDVDEQMPSQQSSQPSQASSQANHHASHALPPIQVPPAAGSAPSPSPSQGSSQAATPTAPATRPRASHFRFFSPKRKSRAATHVTVADAPSGDSTPMSFPSTPTYLPLDSPSASSAARGGESSRSTSSFMDAAPSCFPVFRRQSSSSSTPRSRTAKPSVITIPLRIQASATSASEVTTVEIPCIRTEPPLDPTKQPPSLPEMQARLSQPDGSLPVPELLSYLRPRPSSPRRAPAASADDSAPSSAASSAASSAPQKRGFAKPAWMEAIRAAKPDGSLAGQAGAANGAASGGLPAGTDARRASSQFLASNPARKPVASAAGLAASGGSAEKGSSRAGVSITIPADQPDSELRGQLEQHEQPREPREPREPKKKVRSPAMRPAQPPESPSAIPLDSRQSPKPSPSSLVDPRQSPRLSSPHNPRAGGKLVPPLVLPMRGACEAEKEKPLRRRDSAQRGAGTGEGAGGSASGGEESAYLSCKSPSASSVASSVTEGWSPFMSSAGSVSGSSNAGSGGSSPYHAETLTPALTSVLKMRAMVRVPVGGSAGQVAGQGGQDGQVEAGRQERKERKERKERSEKHERREKLERHGVHKSHMEVEGEGEEGGAAAAVHMVASAEGADVVRSNGEHRTHSSSHSHGHSGSQSQSHGARKARGLGSIVRAFAALSTAQPDSGAGNGVTTAGSKSSSVPVTPVRNPFSSNVSSSSSSAKSASAHVASLRTAGATSAGLRASASVAAAAAAASANVGAPAAANASSYTNSSSSSAYSSGSGSAPPFRPPVPKWGEGGVGTGRVKGGALAEARAIIKQRQMLLQQQQQQQQQQGGDFGHGDGMVGLAPGGTWLASR
ncbi:unnamed protein product [Closterium sp. Naga37s-1]|nr:unnamed protein product [Closterium sp. Naga37s-1]